MNFDLHKLKRRADSAVQEQAMDILRTHLSNELKLTFGSDLSTDDVNCFLYLVLRICFPKLIQSGGAVFGTANQHRIKLFNKLKDGFSLRLFAKLLEDPSLSLMVKHYIQADSDSDSNETEFMSAIHNSPILRQKLGQILNFL